MPANNPCPAASSYPVVPLICPPKKSPSCKKRNERHDHRPEHINVRERVKGKTPRPMCGSVPLYIGSVAMRHFMENDRKDDDEKREYPL